MTTRALNTISTVAWITVLLGVALFSLVAVCAPETGFVRNAHDRDDRIQSVKSSSDLREVQGTATDLLEEGYATGNTAMILCRIFGGTLLLAMFGAVITLRQVRRLRRESAGTTNAT